jgi:hypothetical protein
VWRLQANLSCRVVNGGEMLGVEDGVRGVELVG